MNGTYDVQTRDASTIVNVAGDLDFSSTAVFALVAELSHEPLERLIISLEHCTFCDAAALTMLVRAHNVMQESRLFVVLPEQSQCQRVFKITGLIKLLRVVPTLDYALRTVPVAA